MDLVIGILKRCASVACADDSQVEVCAATPPVTLLTLPTDVLEAICARLSLRDRIALTSCCRALLARPGLLSSQALWGCLRGRWRPEEKPRYDDEQEEESLLQRILDRRRQGQLAAAQPLWGGPPPLAAWLARRIDGLRALRLALTSEAEAREVAGTLAHASRLTHLELAFYEDSIGRIPPCLASLPPSALVALEVPCCRRLGEGGASALAPLRQCTALTRLVLPHCGLRCLPGSVLSSLPALAELDISANQGVQRGSGLELARLTTLTRLDITHTPCSRLPKQLAALPALRSLALDWKQHLCQGREADWAPLSTRLRSLRLSSHGGCSQLQLTLLVRLSVLAGLQVEDLALDRSVDLGGPERLRTALEPLRHLTALTRLSLCGCKARGGLPPQLSALQRLAHLDVSDNPSLEDVEGEAAYEPLRHLTALTRLDACRIGLRVVPPQLAACTRLVHLSLESGCLMSPEGPECLQTLGQLRGLTRLDLSGCGLQELPPQLSACAALLDLEVGENSGLGSWGAEVAFEPLCHLAALTNLSIRACGLRALPPQLSACTALRELWLGGNQHLGLAEGGEAFEPLCRLASLTYLSLRSCFMQRLPPQLSACIALRKLDISCNNVGSWCKGALEPLLHLTALAEVDISTVDRRGHQMRPSELPPLLHKLVAKGLLLRQLCLDI